MGLFEDLGNTITRSVTQSLRKFVAFLFIIYVFGVIVGMHVATFAPDFQLLAVLAPIALAALAYVSTGFAVAIFILVALFLFFL